VLVWGLGRHGGGLAAARFCEAQGATIEVLDARPLEDFPDADAVRSRGWTHHEGDAGHPAFADADLIVPSPAIPPRAWPEGHVDGERCRSPEALFFAVHRGRRIAVTGTKGKSTTANLLGAALGWRVIGNSHLPMLALLGERGPRVDVVCELSSFQLHYLDRCAGPDAAGFELGVFTGLDADHLDWHPDLDHYLESKLGLRARCPRIVADAAIDVASAERLPPAAFDDAFFHDVDGARLCAIDELPLLGAHNRRNAALAIAAARAAGASREACVAALRGAEPLPHRLATVADDGRHRFVDDSVATTPLATFAALDAVDGPVAVLLGGADKGADYAPLADAVAGRGAAAICFGATGDAIAKVCAAVGARHRRVASLDDAVAAALAELPDGGTVLLSPACASLDAFADYAERGERFAALARELIGVEE